MNRSTQPEGNQLLAVESTQQQLLVVAPPGCGKTEVLAMRVAHLVESGAVRPHRRVLAITYSKRARDNMAQRIQNRIGFQQFRRFVTVQNFHGLAGRLVSAHGRTIGLSPDITFPSKRWLSDALADETDSWPVRIKAEAVLRALKSRPIDDEQLINALADSGNAVALAVEERRVREGRLDYPDLLRHAQRILRVPEVSNLYQQHFDGLVLDEFQDLSVQQLEIVSNVCVRNCMYVGDPLQGIYSWAGAEPDEVLKMLETRCDLRIDLDVSYRSSPEVLALVNAVAVPMGGKELRPSESIDWANLGRSLALSFVSDKEEAAAVVKLVRELANKYPEETVGIISRSSWRRTAIDTALRSADGLPVQFWDLALSTPGVLTMLKRCAVGIKKNLSFEDQLAVLRGRALEYVSEDDVDGSNELDGAIGLIAEAAGPEENVRQVLERFREVNVSETVPPGVHVLNAHVGKGQQFDWVFVVGLEQGHVPDFRGTEDPEEKRVLMVMLSRAKRGLVVTKAQSTTTRFGMKAQVESEWWGALAAVAQSRKQIA